MTVRLELQALSGIFSRALSFGALLVKARHLGCHITRSVKVFQAAFAAKWFVAPPGWCQPLWQAHWRPNSLSLAVLHSS
jgi:hypothetical protein